MPSCITSVGFYSVMLTTSSVVDVNTFRVMDLSIFFIPFSLNLSSYPNHSALITAEYLTNYRAMPR